MSLNQYDPKDVFYIDNPNKEKAPTDAPVIAVVRGESGYWPIYTMAKAADLNRPEVTEADLQAAYMGSLFGWDVPGADPEMWKEKKNDSE